MGILVKNKFFLKKGMFIFAGVFSAIGIVFNSVAMGTDYWIVSKGSLSSSETNITINYGLFNGRKTTEGQLDLAPVPYSLTVFCPGGEGVCLVSCGTTDVEQKQEFDYLRFGKTEYTCKRATTALKTSRSRLVQLTSDISVKEAARSEPVRGNDQFMDYGLWVTTLIFLSLMLAFQVISAGLCFFNAVTVPIEMLIGPMGIYLANGVVGLTGLITLSLWGDLFSSKLSSELAIQETILDVYRMSSSNLGYSYWFVLCSLIFAIASSVCIRFRNSLRKFSNQNVVGVESSTPGGMLY
ncbi:uncharacterized protein LOC130686866 [Daphnia carinata]|uniref:uncharacterized protein LOC130686866 n=1 Tax=Daphnia carinata TaxID=120202 RepID=UPI00258016EA|nr:uncharacterized protein LOC130686866 [Daphnia carinata]